MSNEDSDFCSVCGKGVWQHGVSSVEVGGKTYCWKCAPEEEKIMKVVTPRVGPPPLPVRRGPPPLPGVVVPEGVTPRATPPVISAEDLAKRAAEEAEVAGDFCARCGTGIYGVGVGSVTIDDKGYCMSCADKMR